MVRSKNIESRLAKFNKLSDKEKRRLARTPNSDFKKRLAVVPARRIWSERGIALNELGGTPIPEQVNALGWGHFIANPGRYHIRIVKEFYAAMRPDVFLRYGAVMVRGQTVTITAELINEHFGTTVPEHAQAHIDEHGLTQMPIFRWYNGAVSASIRMDGRELWNTSNQIPFAVVHPELGLWTIFIKHSMKPSSNRELIAREVAYLLYSIKNTVQMDLGHIIHNQILDTGDRDRGILTFPCLITHFCRLAGIDLPEDDNDWRASPADLGSYTFNHQLALRGLPPLPGTWSAGDDEMAEHESDKGAEPARQGENQLDGGAEQCIMEQMENYHQQQQLWHEEYAGWHQEHQTQYSEMQGWHQQHHAQYSEMQEWHQQEQGWHQQLQAQHTEHQSFHNEQRDWYNQLAEQHQEQMTMLQDMMRDGLRFHYRRDHRQDEPSSSHHSPPR